MTLTISKPRLAKLFYDFACCASVIYNIAEVMQNCPLHRRKCLFLDKFQFCDQSWCNQLSHTTL